MLFVLFSVQENIAKLLVIAHMVYRYSSAHQLFQGNIFLSPTWAFLYRAVQCLRRASAVSWVHERTVRNNTPLSFSSSSVMRLVQSLWVWEWHCCLDILNDHGRVTSPRCSPASSCPGASLCVSAPRTPWTDVSSLKWGTKTSPAFFDWGRSLQKEKKKEKKNLTATKAPPSNAHHGPFPTALSNTMKHLQKAHSVNTFPECGMLETEKTEGALVCCLVGK